MNIDQVEYPYGAYWSTPFVKWQGAFQHLHAMRFAAWTARRELAARSLDPAVIDSGVVGLTNAQFQSFYGAPWPLHELGAAHAPGHMVTQVCATGARVLFAAASEIQLGMSGVVLALAADRCSNGAHIYYPSPAGPGGYGRSEDQVVYNMMNDAVGGHSMLDTAENVAQARDHAGGAGRADLSPLRPVPGRPGRRAGLPAPVHDPAVRGPRARLSG